MLVLVNVRVCSVYFSARVFLSSNSFIKPRGRFFFLFLSLLLFWAVAEATGGAPKKMGEDKSAAKDDDDDVIPCGICFDEVSVRGVISSCNHIYCFDCIEQWAKVRRGHVVLFFFLAMANKKTKLPSRMDYLVLRGGGIFTFPNRVCCLLTCWLFVLALLRVPSSAIQHVPAVQAALQADHQGMARGRREKGEKVSRQEEGPGGARRRWRWRRRRRGPRPCREDAGDFPERPHGRRTGRRRPPLLRPDEVPATQRVGRRIDQRADRRIRRRRRRPQPRLSVPRLTRVRAYRRAARAARTRLRL